MPTNLDIQEVGADKAHVHHKSDLKTALCGYETGADYSFIAYADRPKLEGKVESCPTCELIISLQD